MLKLFWMKFFPEVQRFPVEIRNRAWETATNAPARRISWWVLLVLVIVGSIVWVTLSYDWLKFPFGFLFHFVTGMVAGFMLYLPYKKVISQELRRQLNAMGLLVCMNCGYDLRGCTENRCSECGKAFVPGDEAPSPPL